MPYIYLNNHPKWVMINKYKLNLWQTALNGHCIYQWPEFFWLSVDIEIANK